MKKIYFTKQPDDIRFLKGTWVNASDTNADHFISEGLAIPYEDKGSKKQDIEELSDEFPHKKLLESNELYTIDQVAEADVKDLDGIGPKKAKEIKQYLSE